MSYQRFYTGNDWRDDGSYDSDRGGYQDRSSAREYRAAGMGDDRYDNDRTYGGGGNRGDRFGPYGERGYGGGYRGAGPSGYGSQSTYGQSNYGGRSRYDDGRSSYGSGSGDRGQYGHGGRNDQGDYDYQDRGFFSRAGDEVRSWFGDEDAERRRRLDQRYDEQHDPEYHGWRQRQIEALDRDYHDYRHERQQSFNQQFDTWRGQRDRQRQSLTQVREHMDVVGSDGEHVGTVDKVRGDRIILTKSDADAGGHHHSIPVGWLQSVDDKVTLNKTAEEAQRQWRDEERGALFGTSGAHYGERTIATTGNRFGGY